MSWIILALFSAISAAGVAIFAKLGLKEIDSTLATTIRSLIMTIFLLIISIILKKLNNSTLSLISHKDWILISLAGIAGAISWLFYFLALKSGPAAGVSALDRTSIIFVVFLAVLFLGESWRWQSFFGALLMICGIYLIILK